MNQKLFNDRYSIDPKTGCHIWLTDIDVHGYGRYSTNGDRRFAHIVSYEMVKGKVPDGLELDHLCRNHACVNPDHLEAVTHKENCRRGIRASQHMAKTHCPRGHAYTSENTRINYKGRRECLVCRAEWNKWTPEKRAAQKLNRALRKACA